MRYLTIKVGTIVGAIVPHLLLASAMFMLLRYLNTELAALHEALRLLVAVAVGGATYLAASWLLRLKALNEGVELLRGMLARKIQ